MNRFGFTVVVGISVTKRVLLSPVRVSPHPRHVLHPILHCLAVGQKWPAQSGRGGQSHIR